MPCDDTHAVWSYFQQGLKFHNTWPTTWWTAAPITMKMDLHNNKRDGTHCPQAKTGIISIENQPASSLFGKKHKQCLMHEQIMVMDLSISESFNKSINNK